MAYLSVEQGGDGITRRVEIGDSIFSIGRGASNDLHFRNPWLSRVHARIVPDGDRCVLVDAGSRNGTYLNGGPLAGEHVLVDGDIIALGDIVLRFCESESNVVSALQVGDSDRPLPAANTVRIASQELTFETYAGPPDDMAQVERTVAGRGLMTALTKAASVLIGHRPLEELLEMVIDLAQETVGAERAALLLRPPGTDDQTYSGRGEDLQVMTLRGFDGQDVHISRTLIEEVFGRRQAVLTMDARSDNRFEGVDSIMLEGIRAIICVPLWNNQVVTGLLYLDHLIGGATFTETDLRATGLIANLAAVKIENVRLLEQQLEKERMAEQLQLAAKIQSGLLPTTPPRVDGYELTGQTRSCFEIGGDYYDFILRADGKLVLVIADISGKGVAAALLMAVLQASLRALVRTTNDEPAVLVGHLNRVLTENSPPNKFATLFYGELDPESHVLDYVLAGHNPPLVWDGLAVTELQPCGPVVGLVDDAQFRCRRLVLAPEAVLLLYTDGIVELEAGGDEEYGIERLSELLSQHSTADGPTLIEAISHSVENFGDPASGPEDDATVVVVRRLAAADA